MTTPTVTTIAEQLGLIRVIIVCAGCKQQVAIWVKPGESPRKACPRCGGLMKQSGRD